MPLKSLELLVIALLGASAGFYLVTTEMSRCGSSHESAEYRRIVLMALSLLSLWSSIRFLVDNRQRSDVIWFIVALAPIYFAASILLYEYLAYALEAYGGIFYHPERW